MVEIFLKILNMSISASWIVLALILLRLLLKKAPKWITVLLWGIVAVRLICPFSIESVISLIPSAETISPEIMKDRTPEINTGIPIINNSINPIISSSFSPEPLTSANPLQIWIPILSVVWIAGIVLLLIYTAISYWRVKRKIGTAVLLRDNIYQSENVVSPFVLGIVKPKIYLPFNMNEQDMEHVIAHEQAHIRRKDHLWKPFGFLLLTIHWFNPLMWLGYMLLCRDIELACDEKVIKELNTEQKADYLQALLTCSVNRRMIAACPLAFGEVGVKKRVKSVLNYKKPAFWIVVVAITVSVVLAVCFLTDPVSDRLENIENRTLNSIKEETVAVWVTDGETYHSIGAISKDLLRDLSDIKISRKEISLNRSEDRDSSHTLVLQTKQNAELPIYSYFKGLYIHFSSDFTSVWVNDGVKPTLSYKVINPKKAKEVYEYIENYNVSESVVGGADAFQNVVGKQLTLDDVKNVSWSYQSCPVDNTGDNFNNMIEIGGMPPNAYMSSIQSLATVKITSVRELQSFISKMESTMNFNQSYPDVASFNDISKEYTAEYFENTTLFLIYTSAGTSANRFSLEYATKSLGVLSIGITKSVPNSGDTVIQGWLICVGIPKDDVKDIDTVDARISSENYPDSGTANAEAVRIYSFRDSKEEIIKPSFTLYDNGKFTFTFSGISSYLGVGNYVLENGRLTLKTDDGQYVYCFDEMDDTMVFDAKASSKMLWFSDMYDGCVFK